ncbi:MAG: winged helix-turn-helix domain-containing protein [Candidatus Competibacteraceae bacterium]|nr:MAG: winged helix-turn-helix domain-containing protein [Candidatus Competibacteraceae bacterium]
MDEQELIENPEVLLALVQKSVQHLIEQRPDTAEQEAQLRAVAKAIEQLEKQRVPVPDSLRQTKMNLVAEIGHQDQFERQLRKLGDSLAEALEIIEEAIGKPRSEGKPQKKSTPHQRRPRNSDEPVTPQSVLRGYIIQALKEFGGSARTSDVLERIQEMLKDRLTPRDLETRSDGRAIVWENNARWERAAMIREGLLRNDSKFGYWELNPDYASGLEKTKGYTTI